MLDEYIKGAFFGMFILCVFMLAFPAKKTCVVEIGRGNVTHVTVGEYRE